MTADKDELRPGDVDYDLEVLTRALLASERSSVDCVDIRAVLRMFGLLKDAAKDAQAERDRLAARAEELEIVLRIRPGATLAEICEELETDIKRAAKATEAERDRLRDECQNLRHQIAHLTERVEAAEEVARKQAARVKELESKT